MIVIVITRRLLKQSIYNIRFFYCVATLYLRLKNCVISKFIVPFQDSMKLSADQEMLSEWLSERDTKIPQVILHDKLMSDALLGTLPIKTEHSYSLNSDGDSMPDSPGSNKMDGKRIRRDQFVFGESEIDKRSIDRGLIKHLMTLLLYSHYTDIGSVATDNCSNWTDTIACCHTFNYLHGKITWSNSRLRCCRKMKVNDCVQSSFLA